MAEKRMFSRKLISSDAFLDMPLSTQALFFHLCMKADDDGFVDAPKKICREIGAPKSALMNLIEKRYVLSFPSGVILIKHWFLHNSVPKDRYTETIYTEERSRVKLKCGKTYLESGKNDNKAYTEVMLFNMEETASNRVTGCLQVDTKAKTECIQSDSKTEHSIDKSSKEKVSKEKNKNTLVHSDEMHDTDSKSLEQFFESIWKLYPLKKGKGQVSRTKKRILQKIGYEHLKRCVERYDAELKATGKEEFTMHGSTFFNSGYVDYLDENYQQDEVEKPVEEVETDRFACLEADKRSELESQGVIDGQSLILGNATDEQIKYLQECGVL